jgi:hypothetical protein
MGKLSEFIAGQPEYFREGAEDQFPWDSNDRSVWYSLLVVENGRIERYDFTSSKPNKAGLRSALQQLAETDEALLLGVWTGQHYTSLFVLSIPTAIEKLRLPL